MGKRHLLFAFTFALIFSTGVTKAQLSFDANIVSHWSFDDEAATDSKTGATGEIVGDAVTFTDGISGKAIDFSSYVTGDIAGVVVKDDGSNLNAINFTTESFSISLWAIVDPSAAEQTQIIKGTNGPDATDFEGNAVNNANGYRYTIQTKEGEIRFAIDDNDDFGGKTQLGVNIADLATPYPTGEWVNIVGVRDRESGNLYLYLNGAQIGESVDGTGDLNIAGQDLVIGNYVTGANVTMGPIDEVMIMNKALSADEVAELYNNLATSFNAPKLSVGALKIQPTFVNNTLSIQEVSDFNTIEIYNLTGALVKSVNNIEDNVTLDVNELTTGKYIVKGIGQDKVTVGSFIKQ
ncbi:LamG-like jellyroll fold domain-containing protein [Saccharicrinis sp. FJH2]|uniref:LamG-like jellyroll fold domain-containing protein n=1 Tax=Saccharicrinis sp. FJH65 TaxID=3344659 RepID=UPI0035F22E9D